MEIGPVETFGQVAAFGGVALGVFLLLVRDLIRKLVPAKVRRLARVGTGVVWAMAVVGVLISVHAEVVEEQQPGSVKQTPRDKLPDSGGIRGLAPYPRPSAAGDLGQGTAARRGSSLAAERFLRRAIAAAERVHGPDHPGLAVSLDQLAALYQATGRWAEAEPLLKRAVAIDAKTLDPEHPELAGRLNNLAVLYWATGRPAAAEPLFVRALAILEKRLPPAHPTLAAVRGNYAGFLATLGRHGEAAAARGRRPQPEDHGPWTEAAETETRRARPARAPGGARIMYREAT
jgi:tetratricopeptide (TPR) repeat protein